MRAARLSLGRLTAPDPIGEVLLVSDGAALVALDFGLPEERLSRQLRHRYSGALAFVEADDPQGFVSAVHAYLQGRMDALDGIAIDGGGTTFQRLVWAALRRIPPGETRSYGEIARAIGQPGASRAVGLANGRNPINLVVPCHRVIGSSGALTGYGGGLPRKQWLLAHERVSRQLTLPWQDADRGAAREPAPAGPQPIPH